MTVTTATAARLARVTARTIRAWCRTGRIIGAKVHGRWVVCVASLRHLLAQMHPGARPQPTDRPYKGQHARPKTGRHARVRIGHHMSAGRRTAVLNALVERTNRGYVTAAGYLAGIGFPEAERYAPAFGREVAQAYRKAHGEEPYRGCIAVVRGRIHQVFGYADVADLYAGAYSYARTREFLASRRNDTVRALIAA